MIKRTMHKKEVQNMQSICVKLHGVNIVAPYRIQHHYVMHQLQ